MLFALTASAPPLIVVYVALNTWAPFPNTDNCGRPRVKVVLGFALPVQAEVCIAAASTRYAIDKLVIGVVP